MLTERILREIMEEFPRFRLVPKQGDCLSFCIHQFLRFVTFGRMSRYLTDYFTVIGDTLFLAPTWDCLDDRARYVLLCHERVHLQQRRRYGSFGMALIYLLPILPIGLALGRARIEWEAYRATLRATAEVYGIEALDQDPLRATIVARFIGPDYGWMWPFPQVVNRWYERAVAELKQSAQEPTLRNVETTVCSRDAGERGSN